MRLARFLVLAASVLAGCTSASSKPAPSILAQWSGFYGGKAAFETQTIATAAEWTALWQQCGRETPRTFDPAQERAVVVFLGQRRTGGYRVTIEAVREENRSLLISYREHTPPAGSSVPQVLTAPWAVAIVPMSSLPVAFRALPADHGTSPKATER